MADSAKDILARLSDAPETEVYELIARYSEDPRKQVIKALESAKRRIEKRTCREDPCRRNVSLSEGAFWGADLLLVLMRWAEVL